MNQPHPPPAGPAAPEEPPRGAGGLNPARLRRLLEPTPERGNLIGAAALVLTVGIALVNVRLERDWDPAIHFLLTGLACAAVLHPALLLPRTAERPRTWVSVVLVCGLALLGIALLRLAEVFGEGEPLDPAGARVWLFLLFGAAAAYAAWRCRSAIATLIAALAGGQFVLAVAEWVLQPDGRDLERFVLVLVSIAFVAASLWLRDRPGLRRHSVQLANAAGVSTIQFALTFGGLAVLLGLPSTGEGRPGVLASAWLVVASFALIAYAAVDREPGAGYLGALSLLLLVIVVGRPDRGGGSLIGWPILLVLVGGGALGYALWARRSAAQAGAGAGVAPGAGRPPPPGYPPPAADATGATVALPHRGPAGGQAPPPAPSPGGPLEGMPPPQPVPEPPSPQLASPQPASPAPPPRAPTDPPSGVTRPLPARGAAPPPHAPDRTAPPAGGGPPRQAPIQTDDDAAARLRAGLWSQRAAQRGESSSAPPWGPPPPDVTEDREPPPEAEPPRDSGEPDQGWPER